jgi:hypothetical protein
MDAASQKVQSAVEEVRSGHQDHARADRDEAQGRAQVVADRQRADKSREDRRAEWLNEIVCGQLAKHAAQDGPRAGAHEYQRCGNEMLDTEDNRQRCSTRSRCKREQPCRRRRRLENCADHLTHKLRRQPPALDIFDRSHCRSHAIHIHTGRNGGQLTEARAIVPIEVKLQLPPARLEVALLIVQNPGDDRRAAFSCRREPFWRNRNCAGEHLFERGEELGARAFVGGKIIAVIAGFAAERNIFAEVIVAACRPQPQCAEQPARQWRKGRVVIDFLAAKQRIEILAGVPIANLHEPLEMVEPGPPNLDVGRWYIHDVRNIVAAAEYSLAQADRANPGVFGEREHDAAFRIRQVDQDRIGTQLLHVAGKVEHHRQRPQGEEQPSRSAVLAKGLVNAVFCGDFVIEFP